MNLQEEPVTMCVGMKVDLPASVKSQEATASAGTGIGADELHTHILNCLLELPDLAWKEQLHWRYSHFNHRIAGETQVGKYSRPYLSAWPQGRCGEIDYSFFFF